MSTQTTKSMKGAKRDKFKHSCMIAAPAAASSVCLTYRLDTGSEGRRGGPRKQGAGAHGWGVAGDELKATTSPLDKGDPNYDSQARARS